MIEEWLNEYGEVTSFSFMIYSYYGVRDNAIINFALTDKLINSNMVKTRYCQSIEDVHEESAEELNVKRGLNVQWVFPQSLTSKHQKIIIDTISMD